MIIQQISVFLEDKTGRLSEMTKILAENDINISSINVADASDYGIVRLIVNDSELASKVLKENTFSVNITDVVCITVPHEPAGLYRVLEILSANNIPVDYMYAFALNKSASVVLRSTSNEEVLKILKENQMELLEVSDIYQV